MIQAPQTQYIPAQAAVTYPQTGANNDQLQTAQNANTGYQSIYSYPTSSSYLPVQSSPYCTGKPQYNGVNIEIINPQGQGILPNTLMTSPYTNTQSVMPAQYIPVQQPVVLPQQNQQVQTQTVPVNSTPYIQQPQQIQTQTVPVVPEPVIQQTPATEQPQTVEIPKVSDPSLTPESFAARLKTDNLDEQRQTIENLASLVRDNDDVASSLLDTQIFDALNDVINKDTSTLQGPSNEIIELRKKSKDELTAAEQEKASVESPLEKAEYNKLYSLYTIAYMQERLNNELEKRNQSQVELYELPCIDTVIDSVKSNPNPKLRAGAISCLSRIAKPEYKDDLNKIFDLALSDEAAEVKEAAENAKNILNGSETNAA